MLKFCSVCGEETLFVGEAVYEGFSKTGEVQRCTVCGTEAASESGASAKTKKPDPLAALFGDDAGPERVEVFDVEGETAQLCRKCAHYVLHPFTQRCGLHDREVSATDSCAQFTAKTEG